MVQFGAPFPHVESLLADVIVSSWIPRSGLVPVGRRQLPPFAPPVTAVINVIMMHSLCICVVLRWLYCIDLFSSIAASLFSKLTLLYFINTCVNVCMCKCCELYCLLVACHWSWMYQVAHTMYASPSCSKTFGRQENWCGVVYIFSTTLKATLRLMCDMFFCFFSSLILKSC